MLMQNNRTEKVVTIHHYRKVRINNESLCKKDKKKRTKRKRKKWIR